MASFNNTYGLYGGGGGGVVNTNSVGHGTGGSSFYPPYNPMKMETLILGGGVTKAYVDDSIWPMPTYVETLSIPLPDGSIETVNRSELVKYISERKLRESNELVRAQWDRYQVTVKIVGSTDNGQENEG